MFLKKLCLLLPLMLILSVILSGCNAFEPLDRTAGSSDFAARLGEAKLELAAANYSNALDLFDRIAQENGTNDEVLRGRAAALAGLAGFNMFSVLNRLQNSVIVPDSPEVIFYASRLITDSTKLGQAIDDMHKISLPTLEDKLFRSLMASLASCRKIIEKYDTNLNGKLDAPDQISFSTNDSKTDSWSAMFADITSVSSSRSLEKAFIELTKAFDQRGSAWIMISPVQEISYTGTYTPANRDTINAIGKLADALEEINNWFDKSEATFKSLLISLDGAI